MREQQYQVAQFVNDGKIQDFSSQNTSFGDQNLSFDKNHKKNNEEQLMDSDKIDIQEAKHDYYILYLYTISFGICWIIPCINRILQSCNIDIQAL